jgi:hypothetical protein
MKIYSYYDDKDFVTGPFTEEEIVRLIKNGTIKANTSVFTNENETSAYASEYEAFAYLFNNDNSSQAKGSTNEMQAQEPSEYEAKGGAVGIMILAAILGVGASFWGIKLGFIWSIICGIIAIIIAAVHLFGKTQLPDGQSVSTYGGGTKAISLLVIVAVSLNIIFRVIF